MVGEKEVHFIAISGQHSAKAAQYLKLWSTKQKDVLPVWKRHEFRNARILAWDTPRTVLAQYSELCNKVNDSSMYKPSYEEMLIHARNQWRILGSPARPGIGANKHSISNNQNWLVRKQSLPTVLITRSTHHSHYPPIFEYKKTNYFLLFLRNGLRLQHAPCRKGKYPILIGSCWPVSHCGNCSER